MLFLQVLKLHLWPKTQHIKNSHFLFLEFCSLLLCLCCSHASSHFPEDGVNVMVMTCFLVSMRIRRCQSLFPWGFALAQLRSQKVLGDEWIRMHKSKQISCFMLSFCGAYSFLFPCATLTFLSAALLLDALNVNQCSQLHSFTLLFLREIFV